MAALRKVIVAARGARCRGAVAAAVVLLLAGCAASVANTGPVAPAASPPVAAAMAEVVPGTLWTLSFPVDGVLVEQSVEAGGRAATDQVLAVLDPVPFEARVSDRAAALEAAERRRVGGYMEPEAMRAMLPSVVAPDRFDALRVAVLQAEMGVATAGLELRRAMLDTGASVLRAPAAVQVRRWLAPEGRRLAAGTPVVEVADTASVRVVLERGTGTAAWRPGTRVLARRGNGEPVHGRIGPPSSEDPDTVPVIITEAVELQVGERLRISAE